MTINSIYTKVKILNTRSLFPHYLHVTLYIYSLLDGVVHLSAFVDAVVWIWSGSFSPRGARISLAGVTRTKAYSHLLTPRNFAASSAEESSLLMIVLSGMPRSFPMRSPPFSVSFSASDEYLREVMSSLSFFSYGADGGELLLLTLLGISFPEPSSSW